MGHKFVTFLFLAWRQIMKMNGTQNKKIPYNSRAYNLSAGDEQMVYKILTFASRCIIVRFK